MNSEILKKYTGDNIFKNHHDEAQKRCIRANLLSMRANYLETVDAALGDEQILLCDETEDVLYLPPSEIKYIPGTRPVLEKYVSEITSGCQTDTQKALKLMDFICHSYEKTDGRVYFYGGTEEELIKKGENLCECVSRLMCALCEICSIPARIITHISGGHLTCEVFTGGKWWYMDVRKGLYFVLPNGEHASLREIIKNPDIMDNQPSEVKSHVSPRYDYDFQIERGKKVYFHDREVHTFKYYSLMDSHKYSYRWLYNKHIQNLNFAGVEYGNSIRALKGSEETKPNPEIIFSVKDGQELSGTVLFCAMAEGFGVPPAVFSFTLDGKPLYTLPPYSDPLEIHIMQGNFINPFGGTNLFDTKTVDDGEHTICAETYYGESMKVCSKVTFTVNNKAVK